MNYLDRAITEGHAELTGEGKQQKILYVAVNHAERCADPNNDLQPVRKESLIAAIKRYHQTLWAGGKLLPSQCRIERFLA